MFLSEKISFHAKPSTQKHLNNTHIYVFMATKHSLMELVGILTNEEAEDLTSHIMKRRKEMRSRLDKITEVLNNDS